eukprot:gene6887-4914_t
MSATAFAASPHTPRDAHRAIPRLMADTTSVSYTANVGLILSGRGSCVGSSGGIQGNRIGDPFFSLLLFSCAWSWLSFSLSSGRGSLQVYPDRVEEEQLPLSGSQRWWRSTRETE